MEGSKVQSKSSMNAFHSIPGKVSGTGWLTTGGGIGGAKRQQNGQSHWLEYGAPMMGQLE